MKKLIFSSLFSALMFSCSTTGTTANQSKIGKRQESIINTQWVLADYVKGETPTLVLQGTTLSGNAGCNNYSGELLLDATIGNFSAKNIGATRMACDNLASEANFLKMLGEANKYVVSGNVLELYKANLLLLKFNRSK